MEELEVEVGLILLQNIQLGQLFIMIPSIRLSLQKKWWSGPNGGEVDPMAADLIWN